MQTQLVTFNAPKKLLQSFDFVMQKRSQSRSDFYREAMQQLLREEQLLDEVFNSSQKQVKKLGLKSADVNRLIQEVRENK